MNLKKFYVLSVEGYNSKSLRPMTQTTSILTIKNQQKLKIVPKHQLNCQNFQNLSIR